MAFSSTVYKRDLSGTTKSVSGLWSGSAGDASGTFTVGSGFIKNASFRNEDADSPKEFVQTDISYASGIATITVHNHQDVTNGKFDVTFY
jgi:hypothetical protein